MKFNKNYRKKSPVYNESFCFIKKLRSVILIGTKWNEESPFDNFIDSSFVRVTALRQKS